MVYEVEFLKRTADSMSPKKQSLIRKPQERISSGRNSYEDNIELGVVVDHG